MKPPSWGSYIQWLADDRAKGPAHLIQLEPWQATFRRPQRVG